MSSAKKIFFLGAGNMGGAILLALANNGYPANSIFFYEPNDGQAEKIAKSGAQRISSLADGFSKSEITFLCVKPQVFSKISASLGKNISKNITVVSIMAGVPISKLREALGKNTVIVRTMPNIAVTAEKGTVAIATDGVDDSVLQTVEFLFSTCADTVRVLESQIDAVTGLSGSGPAFVFQFADALAMGGVKMGLSWDVSMKLALSTILGAHDMLEKFGKSAGELTASVCSPAGTTIAGLQELEKGAFKGVVMGAVEAAAKRSAELGKS